MFYLLDEVPIIKNKPVPLILGFTHNSFILWQSNTDPRNICHNAGHADGTSLQVA